MHLNIVRVFNQLWWKKIRKREKQALAAQSNKVDSANSTLVDCGPAVRQYLDLNVSIAFRQTVRLWHQFVGGLERHGFGYSLRFLNASHFLLLKNSGWMGPIVAHGGC